MISLHRDAKHVVLMYPTQSLLDQVTDLVSSSPAFSVDPTYPLGDEAIRHAAMEGDIVVVDATQYTSATRHALELILQQMEPEQVAVYTERTDVGLEVFVRVRGVLFLLGPMSREEWEGFLWPRRRPSGRRSLHH